MLIRSKYRACVELEYKSKRTLETSFTFSVSILHKRYTALNHFYKGFCFRTIKMVTAHPTKGGHNAVCDTEAPISFLPDQIFNENFHFYFMYRCILYFPGNISKYFASSQGDASKKSYFGHSLSVDDASNERGFFPFHKARKRKHKNSGRVFSAFSTAPIFTQVF